MPAKPEVIKAFTKSVEGLNFRLELQPKGAKCCDGCEIQKYHFECYQFGECTKKQHIEKVWINIK